MTQAPARVVIIGGGLAGAKGAEAVRDKGFTCPVTLISNEADAPYERPPLSKAHLAGQLGFDEALVHPAPWYAEHGIDLRLQTTATSLDTAAHTVTLADGTTLPLRQAPARHRSCAPPAAGTWRGRRERAIPSQPCRLRRHPRHVR